MSIKETKECRICGNRELIPIMSLGTHSLSGIFPQMTEPDPIEAPLDLVKCNDMHEKFCGLVQLKHSVSPELMYLNHYGYRSGMNKTMSEHLKKIAWDAEKIVNLEKEDVVLDIGSNDGTLLKSYTAQNLKKVGIDPTIAQLKEFYPPDYYLISDFFSKKNFEKINLNKKAKIITSIAMFYDLERPIDFAKEVQSCLDKEGIWILEQSYMPFMLDLNSFDTICHEHLEYYSLKQIKWIMDQAGLRIVKVEFNEANGGSFKIAVCNKNSNIKSNEKSINTILEKEIEKELHTIKPYLDFKERVEKIKEELLSYIKKEKREGKSIFTYGASTKGNTLLQYLNIDNSLITAAADRNPKKWGRRTPKTNIPIVSEESARKIFPDIFLVLPWHFQEEFIEREKDYIESGGTFVFPLPKLKIVSKKNNINIIQFPAQKKKALITGITGQIGSYLAEILIEKGYEVYGIVRRTSSVVNVRDRIDHLQDIHLVYGDLSDSNSIEKIVGEIKPDEIYNLAAQSHVGISFDIPEYTSDVGALGVLRICEAAKRLKNKVRVYQASTSELYGGIYDFPVNENTQFSPKSPYGIAKLYGYWIIKNYRESYNMFCSNGIVFNSESPRRGENFVTRKITLGISEIIQNKREYIELGNLNSKRDWNHAKDTALAMWLILQTEKPDDYVIASGVTHSVREFAEEAFKHIGVEIKWKGEGMQEVGYDKKTGRIYVKVDSHYFRPSEVKVLIGDSSKAQKELGWKPAYSFPEIVKEMVEHDLANYPLREIYKPSGQLTVSPQLTKR